MRRSCGQTVGSVSARLTYVKRILLMIVVLFGLVACAPDPGAPNGTPEPEPATASVERWAGLVAERQLDLDDWYAGWDEAVCSSLASSEVDCNLMLTAASFIAQTNDIVIAGPSDPEAKTYLGPVPDEIADLYAETIALTGAARSAAQAWSDADCGVGVEGDCVGLAFTFESAMDKVRQKFAAWSPYL